MPPSTNAHTSRQPLGSPFVLAPGVGGGPRASHCPSRCLWSTTFTNPSGDPGLCPARLPGGLSSGGLPMLNSYKSSPLLRVGRGKSLAGGHPRKEAAAAGFSRQGQGSHRQIPNLHSKDASPSPPLGMWLWPHVGSWGMRPVTGLHGAEGGFGESMEQLEAARATTQDSLGRETTDLGVGDPNNGLTRARNPVTAPTWGWYRGGEQGGTG